MMRLGGMVEILAWIAGFIDGVHLMVHFTIIFVAEDSHL